MTERSKPLPDKLYYTIREVSEHTGIEAHVLRYWESEFPTLKPKRNRSGSRAYRKTDIELIERIRTLLHDEGYRIEGARKALRAPKKTKKAGGRRQKDQIGLFTDLDRPEKIASMRKDLKAILKTLKEMKAEE